MPGDEGGGSFPQGKVNHKHGKIERSADAPQMTVHLISSVNTIS